jgi:biotin carboxyl carrier protein
MATETVLFPMVGKILSIDVKDGDMVGENDQLAVFESMKMEIPLVAPVAGKVVGLKATVGQSVETDQEFCTIES